MWSVHIDGCIVLNLVIVKKQSCQSLNFFFFFFFFDFFALSFVQRKLV